MAIDLVPVGEPPEAAPEEEPSETAPEPPPPEPKKRGRPPGSKNKPKPEPEAPKKVAFSERLPEPKVSRAVSVEDLLRQRMVHIQARASEDRAQRQTAYMELLAKKMGVF